jgi:hypothetical protein
VGCGKTRDVHDRFATKIRHFCERTMKHLKIIRTYCQPDRIMSICHVRISHTFNCTVPTQCGRKASFGNTSH